MDIDIWQLFQDGLNRINWRGMWRAFTGFLHSLVVHYPIPVFIILAVVALYLLYRFTKAVEQHNAQQAKRVRGGRQQRRKHARRQRGLHNHDHDRDATTAMDEQPRDIRRRGER